VQKNAVASRSKTVQVKQKNTCFGKTHKPQTAVAKHAKQSRSKTVQSSMRGFFEWQSTKRHLKSTKAHNEGAHVQNIRNSQKSSKNPSKAMTIIEMTTQVKVVASHNTTMLRTFK